MREKVSGSQKLCESEIHVQTLLLPQTHQNFPQFTVFSYFCGKGESLPHSSLPVSNQKGVKPLQRVFFCPQNLLSASDDLEAAEKFICCWLSVGRDELSNAAPEGM